MPFSSTRIRTTASRFAAGAIMLTIVTLVSTARMLTDWLKSTITEHPELFNNITLVFYAVIAVLVLLYLNMSRKVFSPILWVVHCFLLVLPVYIAHLLIIHPTELAHIPLYTALATFVTLSFRDLNDKYLPLKAFAIAWAMGVTDEFLQWLHPDRFCDLHDVAINTCSALTGVILAEPLRRRFKSSIN